MPAIPDRDRSREQRARAERRRGHGVKKTAPGARRAGASSPRWAWRRRCTQRTSEPFKGYEGAEQFVTIEPGSGTRTIGQRLIEAGVVRDDATFRAALWRSGRARSLQAGEFRFDRADDAHRSHRQDRARRRVQPAHHVSRGAHHPGDGADLRAAGVRQGRRFRRGGAATRARFATSTRRRPISKAICFRKPTRCRATRPPRSSSA